MTATSWLPGAVGCVLMAAFLRGEGLSWSATLTGAALFPVTPFMRYHRPPDPTWGFAWAPLVLCLVRVASRRPDSRWGVALGLGVALSALTGPPPTVIYTGCVALPFAIHVAWTTRKDGAAWRPLAVTAGVATAVALGIVISASALAPSIRAAAPEAPTGLDALGEGGLRPRHLLGVLLPAMNEHTYVGLLVLALGLWALRRGAPYRPAGTFAGVAVAGLLLMLGDYTPLYPLVRAGVSSAVGLGEPTGFGALWGTATVVLAAAGLDAMSRVALDAPERLKWARAAGAVALVAILASQLPSLDPHTHGEGLALAGVCLGAGVAALIVVRDPRTAGAIAGAMCLVDLLR